MVRKREKQKSDTGIGALITNTLNQTTAHGIPHVVGSTSPVRKFVWAFVVLGSFCMFTRQCYLLFSNYYEYGFVDHVELKYDPSPKFPAVTMCNMNPVLASTIRR